MPDQSTMSPYRMDEPPTSAGKALLSRCFEHWCALHHGLAADDIAAALETDQAVEPGLKREVGIAARLIGELIAEGRMRTYARPKGGGTPSPLTTDDWELDDFRPRVSRSALDPARPFDPAADPTHWIFVELEDFNRIVEASCADVLPAGKPRLPSVDPNVAMADQDTGLQRSEDRHVRMPEIKRRTGMSASTVYRRIDQGRFPRQIPMSGGNIAAWWESDVAGWLADPR